MISVLHGPNLDRLGEREPEIYGSFTLAEITDALDDLAVELGVELQHHQSNLEGHLIDWVHQAARGIVINAGGYTHTSVALRDALTTAGTPYVEVHISNLAAREDFRQRTLIGAHAIGCVSGFGLDSYLLGLRGLVQHLATTTASR